MDEASDLLRAIMGRLDEMNAELKGLRVEVKELRVEVNELRAEVTELRAEVTELRAEVATLRVETNERLEKIEGRLDHYGLKWLEHDQQIDAVKRRLRDR